MSSIRLPDVASPVKLEGLAPSSPALPAPQTLPAAIRSTTSWSAGRRVLPSVPPCGSRKGHAVSAVSYEESQTGPRQDAPRLNQGHCGSPEDNPVLILPASDAASPNPEGSAPRGNPILVPLDVSRRCHRRSCTEDGDWVAYPVDVQGERLLGMARTELQRLCTGPIRYNHAVPGYPTVVG